jgi:hypothetical protein
MIIMKAAMGIRMKVRIEAVKMIFITRAVIQDMADKAAAIISKVKAIWAAARIAGATVTVMVMVVVMAEVQEVTATVTAEIIMEGIMVEEV